MRILRQFGVLVLLLVTSVAPAMACMVPDAQMSAQERDCCRMMKSQCGQMEMLASHGCCHKIPPSAQAKALDAKTVTVHPVVIAILWQVVPELAHPATVGAGWMERPEYSPPKSPPSAISILRI